MYNINKIINSLKIFPQSIGSHFTQVTKMIIPFCTLQIMYDVLTTGGRKTWTPEHSEAQQLTHFPADKQTKQQQGLHGFSS